MMSVSTIDEAASTTDGLGCVDPGGAPVAELLVELGTATAVAAACNREGSKKWLKQSQGEVKLPTRRRGIRVNTRFGTRYMDLYVEIYTPGAAISQIVAIRYYCTLQTCFAPASHHFGV